jgi:triosephosphate isomerase (TIM)
MFISAAPGAIDWPPRDFGVGRGIDNLRSNPIIGLRRRQVAIAAILSAVSIAAASLKEVKKASEREKQMTARRPLIAGNWKMNGLMTSLDDFRKIVAGAKGLSEKVDLIVCPPATLIFQFVGSCDGHAVEVGGQDCHAEPSGAFTGDISAEMLADLGARAVIVGHSERRAFHHESDADVQCKTRAAWRAGLLAIVCLGETRDDRVAGRTLSVVGMQFEGSIPDDATARNLVIAYEPVWAIGTGLTPTPADVAEVHGFIRERLTARFPASAQGIRILYGGSVKPSNAKELLTVDNVDGALVGGASLKPEEFLAIAGAYAQHTRDR